MKTAKGTNNKINIILPICLAACFLIGCGAPTQTRNASAIYYPSNSNQSANQGRLTVMIAQYNQADSIQLAQVLQQRAKIILKSNDVWLQNDKLGLAVNFGHFKNDEQAKIAFARVKKLYRQLQPGPWQFPYIKELAKPDPPAPDEWNLLNNNCEYSLEIGTYYDVPEKNYFDRKQDAVKAVKKLRQDGELAFFVHGRHESRVYVGCASENQIKCKAKQLQKNHPFLYEHGAEVYSIEYDENKRKIRKPRRSRFIKVQLIRKELSF